jgi:hypothetical protein
MSRLLFHGRPWVVFDADNKDHRTWFAEFSKNRTWSRCPVRFVIAEEHGDLVTLIQRKLIQYYVNKEFKERTSRSKRQTAKTSKV